MKNPSEHFSNLSGKKKKLSPGGFIIIVLSTLFKRRLQGALGRTPRVTQHKVTALSPPPNIQNEGAVDKSTPDCIRV